MSNPTKVAVGTLPNAFTTSFNREEGAPTTASIPLSDLTVWSMIARDKLLAADIQAMANSIATQGLMEPLVVDAKRRLIAGRHRHKGLELLRMMEPERFLELFPNEMIPISIQPFDADEDSLAAAAVVSAENQIRREQGEADFDRYHKLFAASGCQLDTRGRPPKGSAESVQTLVCQAMGISSRQYRRYLSQQRARESGVVRAAQPVDRVKRLHQQVAKLTSEELAVFRAWLITYESSAPAATTAEATTAVATTQAAVLAAIPIDPPGSADPAKPADVESQSALRN